MKFQWVLTLSLMSGVAVSFSGASWAAPKFVKTQAPQQQTISRLSSAELEDIAVRLTKLSETADLIRNNKATAAEFMAPYMELQNLLLQKLSLMGVTARLVDAIDYGGAPVIAMYQDSPREVKLRYIQESFLPDMAEVMLAPGIEIEPIKNGSYWNNLAFQLSRRFGAKIILDFASFNTVGAAAYSPRDNYLSLPPAVLSNAMDLQTYHELKHLVQARAPKKKPNIFKIEVSGKEALKVVDAPYNNGYSVDELRAYAFGVYQEMSLIGKTPTEKIPVLLRTSGKWKVLNSALHGKHTIELTQDPKNKIALAEQVAELNAQFMESLKFVEAMTQVKWSSENLELMNFLDDTLIITSPDSDLKMSISHFGGDNGAPKINMTLREKTLAFNLSKEDSPLLAQALQGDLKSPESRQTALKLWQRTVDVGSPLLTDLKSFLAQMTPLNAQLKQAVEANDVKATTEILRKMVRIIKDYE